MPVGKEGKIGMNVREGGMKRLTRAACRFQGCVGRIPSETIPVPRATSARRPQGRNLLDPVNRRAKAMEVCSLYADCNRQLADYKWIESQKKGFDIGREY